mgnify:FL=1
MTHTSQTDTDILAAAMFGESGYVEPPKAPTRATLPLLNYPGPVTYRNP